MPARFNSIGALLALVILVVVIVLFAIGQMSLLIAGMFAGLAVARLT